VEGVPLPLAYRCAGPLVGVRAEQGFDHQFRRADDVPRLDQRLPRSSPSSTASRSGVAAR
ncbi:hypothetical protein ACFVJK_46120, partial [Streptomyces sp. NPDC127172]|uniref:hypothetical protein n=1 Tax=Streptomyces sp. NPDC127172 TaxID=3345382 RepID=UPI003637032B